MPFSNTWNKQLLIEAMAALTLVEVGYQEFVFVFLAIQVRIRYIDGFPGYLQTGVFLIFVPNKPIAFKILRKFCIVRFPGLKFIAASGSGLMYNGAVPFLTELIRQVVKRAANYPSIGYRGP